MFYAITPLLLIVKRRSPHRFFSSSPRGTIRPFELRFSFHVPKLDPRYARLFSLLFYTVPVIEWNPEIFLPPQAGVYLVSAVAYLRPSFSALFLSFSLLFFESSSGGPSPLEVYLNRPYGDLLKAYRLRFFPPSLTYFLTEGEDLTSNLCAFSC